MYGGALGQVWIYTRRDLEAGINVTLAKICSYNYENPQEIMIYHLRYEISRQK